MSFSAELEDIREELDNAIYNRDIPEAAFIPYDKIQEVWVGDRLGRFLRDPCRDPDHGTDQAISDLEIEVARDGLLRMISILIGIHWSGWSRFKQIFFSHRSATTERRDDNIKSLTYEDLKDESFLGNNDFPRHFLMNRWTYIPVTFDGDSMIPYPKGTRLPLVRQEKWFRKGGFGEVTKEMIPPNQIVLKHSSDHLGIPDQPNSAELVVARKRFPNGHYEVEITRLKLIQSSLTSHKRIVYPLAMVTVDTDLNIIMPWANMDLEDFLIGGYQSMKSTEYFLLDLIYEAGELAAALEFLHDGLQARCERPELQHQAIRHADFKPQNILVFQRGGSSTGIWRVADFGVSQVARRNMSRNRGYESGRSTAVNLNPPPRGGIYEAPDSNAQRRSDIWSFGCILARIFALGLGPGCLPEFDAIRVRPVDGRTVEDRFYGGSPPILNPNVKTWIEDLPKRFHDSHNVELLNGMRDLLFQMLVIDFRDRLSAYQVRSRLHKLCHLPIEPEPEPMPPYRGPAIMPVIPPTPPTTPRSSSHRSNSSRVSQETILTTRNVDHSPDKLEVGVLVNSIRSGSVDNVKQCLRRRPDVEDCHDGDRPLIYAIEKSSVPMIRALWDHKQDLDAKSVSSEGETPLNLAVLKGDVEMVKILIDILVHNDPKASLDKLSGKGKTPLMEAASRGYVAVVSELLNRGADPTICAGENQLNSLHHAVDNIAAKENLLEAFLGKMDFDQSPPGIKYYETPMMRHITHGISGYYGAPKARPLWKKKFDVLLKGGADVNRSYPEKRPLLCAMSKNHVQIAEVLLLADAFLPHGEKGTSHQMRQMIRRVRKSKGSF